MTWGGLIKISKEWEQEDTNDQGGHMDIQHGKGRRTKHLTQTVATWIAGIYTYRQRHFQCNKCKINVESLETQICGGGGWRENMESRRPKPTYLSSICHPHHHAQSIPLPSFNSFIFFLPSSLPSCQLLLHLHLCIYIPLCLSLSPSQQLSSPSPFIPTTFNHHQNKFSSIFLSGQYTLFLIFSAYPTIMPANSRAGERFQKALMSSHLMFVEKLKFVPFISQYY